MRRFISSTLILLLSVVSAARGVGQQLKAEGAPALRILSAPVSIDREKQKVTLSVEVENAGSKTIKAFAWEYRTREGVGDYFVWASFSMPEVATTLSPKEKKKIVLVDASTVPGSILNMPVGIVRITSVAFDDGTTWKREKDEKR